MGRTGRCGEHLLVGTETPATRGPTIARCAPTCPAPRVQAPGCAPVSGDVPGPGWEAPPVCTMGSEDLRPACVLWTSARWLQLSFLRGTPRAHPTRCAATVTGGSVGAPGSPPPQSRPLRGGAWAALLRRERSRTAWPVLSSVRRGTSGGHRAGPAPALRPQPPHPSPVLPPLSDGTLNSCRNAFRNSPSIRGKLGLRARPPLPLTLQFSRSLRTLCV